AIVSLEKDNLNIVKFLLGESADLSSKTYMLLSHGKGVAPLIAAITQNRVDIVSLFLKLNCDINTLDLNKHTALDYAVYYYANDVQKLLLSYNGTCTLSKQDQLRFAAYPVAYPLHEAACEGNLERVRLLIEKDCVDVNEQDQCECTPLHYACMNGHGHIVSYLINDRKAMTCILDKWNKTAF
ncbi:MAG TPA: ankyrin repeat domain-containing protein, partial [Candidatus Dependentiae bacterium]|nr:ankyrin repeat domain-containing protein [Candidatus Dependentiae bacterium]